MPAAAALPVPVRIVTAGGVGIGAGAGDPPPPEWHAARTNVHRQTLNARAVFLLFIPDSRREYRDEFDWRRAAATIP
jgi:hypothetical protein